MTFDNLAMALALVAIVLRLLDTPSWSSLSSSLTVLATALGQRQAGRRWPGRAALALAMVEQSAMPRSTGATIDRAWNS